MSLNPTGVYQVRKCAHMMKTPRIHRGDRAMTICKLQGGLTRDKTFVGTLISHLGPPELQENNFSIVYIALSGVLLWQS